jgi:hypothetical protein
MHLQKNKPRDIYTEIHRQLKPHIRLQTRTHLHTYTKKHLHRVYRLQNTVFFSLKKESRIKIDIFSRMAANDRYAVTDLSRENGGKPIVEAFTIHCDVTHSH